MVSIKRTIIISIVFCFMSLSPSAFLSPKFLCLHLRGHHLSISLLNHRLGNFHWKGRSIVVQPSINHIIHHKPSSRSRYYLMSTNINNNIMSSTVEDKMNTRNKRRRIDTEDDQDQSDEDIIDIEKHLLEEEGTTATNDNSNTPTEYQELSNKFTTNQTLVSSIDALPKGIPDSFSIIHYATIPPTGFTPEQIEKTFSKQDIDRLKLQPNNVTVPSACVLLFGTENFATLTKARKDTRRKKILLHRGPPLLLPGDEKESSEKNIMFEKDKLVIAKVGDRVEPGDTLAIQTRMAHNYDECKNHDSERPFDLPVIYEDDHFAIVNKPEGIVVFSHKNGGFGRQNVNSCLPWVLTPPRPGIVSVMRRPAPVHRIDRGTSGLLVCAKTKSAMLELGKYFRERRVKKTYTAIVNGDIQEPNESSITTQEATNMGVCTSSSIKESQLWQVIDKELEDDNKTPQSAVTIWRKLQQWPLKDARSNTVSLVELKPKTGRYHQLRRHMAWVSNCPLLGDKQYDGGGLAGTFREDGFYLCSNQVTLEHPYYNSPQGRREWNDMGKKEKSCGDSSSLFEDKETGLVMVKAEISLPSKFQAFLDRTDAKFS